MRLENLDNNFWGDLDQFRKGFHHEYEQIAEEYNLTDAPCFRYLQNLLCEKFIWHYLPIVNFLVSFYEKAVKVIDREYTTIVGQKRVNLIWHNPGEEVSQ